MRSMEVTDEWLYQYMPVVDNAMIKALEGQVAVSYTHLTLPTILRV